MGGLIINSGVVCALSSFGITEEYLSVFSSFGENNRLILATRQAALDENIVSSRPHSAPNSDVKISISRNLEGIFVQHLLWLKKIDLRHREMSQ